MLEELLDTKEKQFYLLMTYLSGKPYGVDVNELCLAHNKTRKTIIKYLNEMEEVLDPYSGIFLTKNKNIYCIEKEVYIDIRNIYNDFFLKSKKKVIIDCLFKGVNTNHIITRVRHNHWSYSASRVSFLEIEKFFNRLNIDVETLSNNSNVDVEIYFRVLFYTIQMSLVKKTGLFDYARENQLAELVLKIEKKLKLTLSQEEKVGIGYMIGIANERVELGFGLQEQSTLFEFMDHKKNTMYKKFRGCLSTSPFYKLSNPQEATILYNFFYFCFPEFYNQGIRIKNDKNKPYIELLSYEKINKKKFLYSFILPGDFYKYLPISHYSEKLLVKIVVWLGERKHVLDNKEKTAFSLLEVSTYDDQFKIKIYVAINFEQSMEDKFIELLCFYYPFQIEKISSHCQADILISNRELVSDCKQWVITSIPTMEVVEKELVPILEKEFFKKLAKVDYLKWG